jgi:hypothetical protein
MVEDADLVSFVQQPRASLECKGHDHVSVDDVGDCYKCTCKLTTDDLSCVDKPCLIAGKLIASVCTAMMPAISVI